MDYAAQLRKLPKQHDYFIGFDSDGCVFDSMELKHKECFCPAVIKHLGCQPVSKAAREVWEFVNLYSKTRGCNRFLAIQHFCDQLGKHKGVKSRGFQAPQLPELKAWIERESSLGNPALKKEVKATGSQELTKVLALSLEINERIEDMVSGVPPFPGVMDVLKQLQGKADVIVVSQTPLEALNREWEENEMDSYIKMIAGQEHGTKTEHLRFATEGKGYDSDKILMIGDALGDFTAADENNSLFYPIVPGSEEASWKRLAEEGLAKFFGGTFIGEYQQALLAEFDAALPERRNRSLVT